VISEGSNHGHLDELEKIAATDDLHIAPFREDGTTYGAPTWIWSVVLGDALYVRAYTGKNSRWYRAVLHQKAGRITAAGMTKEVTFEPVEDAINDRINEAYRAKYEDSVSRPHDWRAGTRRNGQDNTLRQQRPRAAGMKMAARQRLLVASRSRYGQL
jgi:hypothetical protein